MGALKGAPWERPREPHQEPMDSRAQPFRGEPLPEDLDFEPQSGVGAPEAGWGTMYCPSGAARIWALEKSWPELGLLLLLKHVVVIVMKSIYARHGDLSNITVDSDCEYFSGK